MRLFYIKIEKVLIIIKSILKVVARNTLKIKALLYLLLHYYKEQNAILFKKLDTASSSSPL